MINSIMSEIIYNQRKEDNEITLYKNYSNIKHHVFNNGIYLPFKPNKGRKIFYFYGEEPVKEVPAHYGEKSGFVDVFTNNNYFKLELVKNKTFQLTKPIQIKRNYNNPFARLDLNLYVRKIIKNGDKLIISSYILKRCRDFNCRIFEKVKINNVISINIKTGNFTTIRYLTKNNTLIRKNSFKELNEVFELISKCGDLNNYVFFNELNKLFNINYSELEKYTFLDVINSIYDFFIKQKQIKVPNEYNGLLNQCYPTEVFLKKNDRKLILSILDKYKIKSNITNKILHQNPNISLKSFAGFLQLLGKDFNKYVSSLDVNKFIHNEKNYNIHYEIPRRINTLTNKDKENLVKIINDVKNNNVRVKDCYGENIHILIVDHINMLASLRDYNLDVSINAKTFNSFSIEHREFSKKYALIKKGYEMEYTFTEKTINEIEEPITIKGIFDRNVIHETFYPVLLKKENEYIEEGQIMHHCVGSYANKVKSVIISIRTKDNKDRITCEFDTSTGNCIQARHVQNAQPPADFILALDELKKKTKKLATYGLLHSTEAKQVPLIINGIEVKKEIPVPYLQEELF